MSWLDKAKQRTRSIKPDVHALYLSVWDARTPWYAKAVAIAVAAYALSRKAFPLLWPLRPERRKAQFWPNQYDQTDAVA
jgi:hypothetical protein